MTAPANNMRSLDRAFDVLDTLQSSNQPLRLSEVARNADLHIATVQRILNVLVSRGFASRTGVGYTAGPAALAVAHAFLMSNPVSALSHQVLQQLAAITQLTASLYVRVEDSRVLVSRVEGKNPLSYVLPVGERLPLHLGGAGKVILAELNGDERTKILDSIDDTEIADSPIPDRAVLLDQLDAIRTSGYAVSVSERLDGIASVTAPVRTQDGQLAAVLGVTGPETALTATTLDEVISEVRRAASFLGSRLP